MSPIVDVLQEIRKNPSLYVGRRSLSLLGAFLRGYDLAMRRLAGFENDEFLRSFQEWVQKWYGLRTSHGWDAVILFFSEDERDALDEFWKRLDEYLADQTRGDELAE